LKKIILIIFSIITGSIAFSQNDSLPKKNFIRNRIFTGGGIGFYYGDEILFQVSPILGYKLTKNLSVGVGGTYQYLKIRDFDITSHAYGGSVFGRYIIWRNIFAYSEYELLHFDYLYVASNNIYKKRMVLHSVFAGGGFKQNFSNNAAMILMVLWNLNDTPYSPYTNPILRIGFELGL